MSLSTAILADSPIGYWKLDDTSGTTAVDSSGNGKDGTYTGGVTLNQSIGGLVAAQFDGSNDYVTIPDSSQVFAAQTLTMEVWIHTTSSTLSSVFAKYNTAANNTKWLFRHSLTSHKSHFYLDQNGGSPVNIVSSPSTDDGAWHQLVGTYNNTSGAVSFYLDTALVGTGTAGGNFYIHTAGTQAVTIGSYDGTFEFFNGYISNCAIFASTLSTARILAHYNAGMGITAPDADTLHETAHIVQVDGVAVNVSASTLHATEHVVGGAPALNVPASTLHSAAHTVAADTVLLIDASTLHGTAHIVSATVPLNLGANTLHETVHIVSSSTPRVANTLHARAHVVSAIVPLNIAVGSLHARVHIVPNRLGYGVIRAIVVPFTVTNPYNPTYVMSVAETPSIAASLLEGSPAGSTSRPNMSGATATFSMYDLGGGELFERAAVIDDASAAKVHYQMQAGDTASKGTFLAKFHVVFSNGSTQDFPEDRYIEILVEA